jgi:hypothetical protein
MMANLVKRQFPPHEADFSFRGELQHALPKDKLTELVINTSIFFWYVSQPGAVDAFLPLYVAVQLK